MYNEAREIAKNSRRLVAATEAGLALGDSLVRKIVGKKSACFTRHMARHRKDDTFDAFFDLFRVIPAWTCIPIAAVAFVFIRVVVHLAATSNPSLAAFEHFGSMFGGFVAVVILVAGVAAGVSKHSRRRLLADQTSIDSIRQLSWSDFEKLVGEAFRQQGYVVEETGQAGPDGGIDLKLWKSSAVTLVQCKQWKAWKVGVQPIRELYGVVMAERADRAVFVTSGVYTIEAKAFAQGKPLDLIDGEGLVRLIGIVSPSMRPAPPTPAAPSASPSSSVVSCPKCGSGMVLRTARRGANAGAQFWGCSTYPQCKGTRAV